jgi:hypothetical protein
MSLMGEGRRLNLRREPFKRCQNSIFPLGNSLGIQRKSDVFQAAEVNLIYWLVVSTCFTMFSYFWSVANNFQCVDDISYMFIHFMLWLCQRVFSALRVAWWWPNPSLSVIRGSSGVVSTQNVQLARNCNIVSCNIM